jgi:hypothetical protein
MADLRPQVVALAFLFGPGYAEAVAVLLLEEVVPYLVLGMFGGLVASFRIPRPTRAYVAVSILRSALVGFAAGHALISVGADRAAVVAGASIASYLAEELLTGLARIAGQWADQPLYTLGRIATLLTNMRAARGIEPADRPKENER